MPKITVTPEIHEVFNELDRQGLLLGLIRLAEETNVQYKRRLLDVFVNRASSTYRGLINGITRELGLSIIEVLRIVPVLGGDGNPIAPEPAVVFNETKCILYRNFCTGDIISTIDRFEILDGSFTLQQLIDTINATGYFVATLLPDADGDKRSLTIFDQSSIGLVTSEDITEQGVRVQLANRNLIEGTVVVSSANITNRVFSEIDLRNSGDFLVDLANGILFTVGAPAPGSTIRYQHRDDNFVAEASPVILHSLQSTDFKTKMFEQILDENGDSNDGLPTELGADIINELLSVFPTSFGQ